MIRPVVPVAAQAVSSEGDVEERSIVVRGLLAFSGVVMGHSRVKECEVGPELLVTNANSRS